MNIETAALAREVCAAVRARLEVTRPLSDLDVFQIAVLSASNEADELLESLGLEEGQNDPIAWTSDLNTVLSKLEMLDAPEK